MNSGEFPDMESRIHARSESSILTNDTPYFHCPELSAIDLGIFRSPGPGLGNLLFPVARALSGQLRYGGEFVYPTMRQIKLGTFLRSERDRRTYGNILRSRSAREWRNWIAAHVRKTVDEHDFDGSQKGVSVRYSEIGRCFHDLDGPSELIKSWLFRNMCGQVAIAPFDIGIHVRLGDFADIDVDKDTGPGDNVRLPLEWYRAALEEARRLLDMQAPNIILFTDGDPEQVEHGLGIGPLSSDQSENALIAMLRLAQARLVITSRSTFSMWATYLGGMPAIWDRRYDRMRWMPYRPGLDYEI